jgi:hypothetical protein
MIKQTTVILLILFNLSVFGQGYDLWTTAFGNESEKKPARRMYASGYIIDGQTDVIPTAKTLEFVIQHRFGPVDNGISDLWGIYGASNIRLGANYSIVDWVQVGFGTTKNYKLQDFTLKVNILKQTRNNEIPVSIAYFGDLAINAQDESYFGKNYQFTDRLSYFTQVIVTRKFTDWLTLAVAGSFSHFNKVEPQQEHDKFAFHFNGRARVSPQSSVILNFDWPINTEAIAENIPLADPPKPNMNIGWEVATSTHAFQFFIGTANYLVPQYNVAFNQNDWTKGDIIIGFNITRLWSF